MIRLFAVVLAGFASVSTAIAAEGIRPVFGMAVTGGGVRKAGLIVQGEYLFWGERGSAYLRYVSEEYTVNWVGISCNQVGVGVAFRF